MASCRGLFSKRTIQCTKTGSAVLELLALPLITVGAQHLSCVWGVPLTFLLLQPGEGSRKHSRTHHGKYVFGPPKEKTSNILTLER